MAEKVIYDLLKAGLTEGEAKVYLALLEIGSSTVGPVVKESKVAYSNIYDILDRLIEKGIVSFIVKKKTRYYHAASPSKILQYLENKEKDISKQKMDFGKILPSLEMIRESKPKQEAEIYIGLKGLRTAYEKLFEGAGKKHEDTFFYIHEEPYAEEADRFYFGIKDILEKHILRGVSNQKFRHSPFIAYVNKNKNILLKFADFPIPGNIEICMDKVLIISWEGEKSAFLIHSQSIADNMRKYWESVWQVAKN